MSVICVGVALLLASCAQSDSLIDPFAEPRPDLWRLSAGEPGTAAIAEGRLALDLSAAKRGKWAYAELKQALTLPARIEWDQCLAHDSQFTWFGGVLVWSLPFGASEHVQAGLGGSGLKRAVFLQGERSAEGVVEEGVWYHLALDVESTRQALTVTRRDDGSPVAALEAQQGLSHAPFFLTLFQNDFRLGPEFVDEYDQDRGLTWIDNLRIDAAKAEPGEPPLPGTTYPFRIPVVFNRATRWLTTTHGLSRGAIAYDAVGRMPLTGEAAVSEWLRQERWIIRDSTAFPPQPHIEPLANGRTRFRIPEGESEATFILRALQWNLEQHPTLEWSAAPRGVSWHMDLTATDGVRPPNWLLWRSEEFAEAGDGSLDVLQTYRAAGRPNRYAEVDFWLRLRRTSEEPGELELGLTMPGRACIVPRSPIVARAGQDVAVEAVVVGANGQVLPAQAARAEVNDAGEWRVLEPVGEAGPWRAVLRGLPPGEHALPIRARGPDGAPIAETVVSVTISQLDFADHYDHEARSYATPSGKALGPLLGDLIAWVPYEDIGSADRRLLRGLQEAGAVTGAQREVSYTKWRALPRGDIDRFVDHMGQSGVRVLRIAPNVSVAEYYLDAGGHLAMHGFEQFSYILAAARRNNIRCVINLFHYPYLSPSTGSNPPVAQLFEAGYRREFGWQDDRMWELLSGYLTELLGQIGTDPAVLGYTVMGENDQLLPAEWINRAHGLIKQHAPQQLVFLEQGGSFFHCRDGDPASYAEYLPASDGGVGYRTYSTQPHPNDCFMAAAARFYNLARPSFLGEVACGVNTHPHFIVKLRDAMGIALTLQQPMAISWCAVLLEDQRRAFTEAADLVDWSSFRRAQAPVAIIVEKPDEQQVARLVAYEQALSALPVDCEYVRPGDDRSAYALVLDAREGDPHVAPTSVEALAPLRLSPGSYCTYALAQDRRTLLAYLRNATRYETLPCDVGRIVENCRMGDRERPVTIDLPGLVGECSYIIWDAAAGARLREGPVEGDGRIDLGETTSDLLLLVQPR